MWALFSGLKSNGQRESNSKQSKVEIGSYRMFRAQDRQVAMGYSKRKVDKLL
jgi:hypothetical protein